MHNLNNLLVLLYSKHSRTLSCSQIALDNNVSAFLIEIQIPLLSYLCVSACICVSYNSKRMSITTQWAQHASVVISGEGQNTKDKIEKHYSTIRSFSLCYFCPCVRPFKGTLADHPPHPSSLLSACFLCSSSPLPHLQLLFTSGEC